MARRTEQAAATERLTPRNATESERNLIAAAVIDPALNDDLWEILRPADFRDALSRQCATVLADMAARNQVIDATLLLNALNELDRMGQWPSKTPPAAYLAESMSRVPMVDNWRLYARDVRQSSMLWSLYLAADCIQGQTVAPKADAEEVLAAAEETVLGVGERSIASQVVTLDEAVAETLEHLERRMSGEAGGISTTFPGLDALLGGLRPGNLTILAARPGRGKTTMALQAAVELAVTKQARVLFVSLEMSRTELCERVLAAAAQVDGDRLRDGTLTQSDLLRIRDATASLSGAELRVEDAPNRTVASIAALCRRTKRRAGLDLVVIDYLQLIRPSVRADSRQEEVAEMTRTLKQMLRQLGVPGLVLAQLSREAEKDDKPPRLHHLRESGAIEQDADQVLMLHEPERGGEAVLNVYVRKNRHGQCGQVSLVWRKQQSRLLSREVDE